MSDVINSIFGRPQNETTGSGEYAYGAVEPAPEVAEVPAESAPETDEAGVVEEVDSAPETESATETAEDEAVDGDQAEEDATGTDEEAVAEDTEDDDTDVNAAEDIAEAEPVAEPVAENEPVIEAVAAEPVADTEPVADAEPVVTEAAPAVAAAPIADAAPAVARPAAGSRGSTTVADGVVGKIVTRIASQAEGVHSVAGDGITVELADEVAWVTIPVVVEFGHAVKAVGEQIRVAVIDAVEQYLGLDVEVVDVHVTDIHFPEAG
ncbi:Asp23/Gls24 family envelope stress response protein [Amycolatopsis sp. DG1A-15b]|uniref:Asp23/Gls24 family envelope stress response protein n=1 Tax=Amycolatopsis sp. DG1A-15b TaxID=3052846 RepID=UPI00255BC2E1|nr:Asp23/Gls24 family envelope stress response protein [Amycolatopsis sp. DG1A-15b]WIX91080.1 Asp23/Gls24 family envelope stress response protein [Amycolatopsis sp. DG1A-15b]